MLGMMTKFIKISILGQGHLRSLLDELFIFQDNDSVFLQSTSYIESADYLIVTGLIGENFKSYLESIKNKLSPHTRLIIYGSEAYHHGIWQSILNESDQAIDWRDYPVIGYLPGNVDDIQALRNIIYQDIGDNKDELSELS